ncbi:MAG: response regulator transcription factor [Lachnospiraceae bacterium]
MKILVVDDELPIREWLKIIFERVTEDQGQILTAGNGKEAFDLFLEESPDLVMADIKMPRMSGLELLQKVKEEKPETYVVMLTSYNEFEYAREAIKYQANEYVLKNEITEDVLRKILNHYASCAGNSWPKERQIFLRNMLETGNVLPELLQAEATEQIFAVSFERRNEEKDSLEPYINTFVQRIEPYYYDEAIVVWVCHCKQLPSAGASYCEAISFCQKISGLKDRSVGFSGFTQRPLDACLTARKALFMEFYERRQSVYTYQPENNEDLHKIGSLRKQVIGLIGQGRKKEAENGMRDFLQRLEECKVPEIELVVSWLWDIVDACKVANLEFAGQELDEMCKDAKRKIEAARTMFEIKRIMEEFLTEIESVLLIQEKGYSKYVKGTLAYVANHYATIESLTEVSDYIGLNAEYFCRLFKAEIGMTFNSYLTDYRIKKAKELLAKTDLMVYEVAEKVGYKNLSYFSRVFKKVTGTNPFFYKTDKMSKME